jgi:hypothetical protein
MSKRDLISKRSPDAAQRNPGFSLRLLNVGGNIECRENAAPCQALPDSAALHPGYDSSNKKSGLTPL